MEYENELGHIATPSVSVNYLLSYLDAERLPFITAYFETTDSGGHVLKHESPKQLSSTATVRNELI